MSILARSRRQPEERSVLADLARASVSSYGGSVSEESSMRHDAVWSCRTRIAQDISQMPVDVVRYVNGERQEVANPPKIITTPSPWTTALDWRYQVVDSWLSNGNAFGVVTAVSGQYPTTIEIVPPTSVTPMPSGAFQVTGHGVLELWPLGRLWHVPAYTAPGQLLGMSPISYHRSTIANGLAAEQFGKSFFDSGGHPTGIIAPGTDPGPDGAKHLKARFLDAVNGASREPIVLPKDTAYIPLQVAPTDSQFIETQRYTVEQICRIFGEDPADHGASAGGSSLTYANRSDAEMARLKRRQFWVTKMQDALTALVPRPQVVKLNTSSALMMTARERHELHKLRLDSGTLTVNEVRRLEDEEPFDGEQYDTPGSSDEPDTDEMSDDDGQA